MVRFLFFLFSPNLFLTMALLQYSANLRMKERSVRRNLLSSTNRERSPSTHLGRVFFNSCSWATMCARMSAILSIEIQSSVFENPAIFNSEIAVWIRALVMFCCFNGSLNTSIRMCPTYVKILYLTLREDLFASSRDVC